MLRSTITKSIVAKATFYNAIFAKPQCVTVKSADAKLAKYGNDKATSTSVKNVRAKQVNAVFVKIVTATTAFT